jgi:nuclear pore complex protein Nup188
MLTVLRLCLQFHAMRLPKSTKKRDGTAINPFNILFCEIATHIVGEGLRTVVAALQDQKQNAKAVVPGLVVVDASDVLLLLNILQIMLRLPNLSQIASQLGNALVSSDAPQSLLLLFSWSHLLDQTPVYGVLTARFLAAMSKLPLVAEDLAVEGVFNRLLVAKTTQKIQKMAQGVGHIDQRPGAAMLYNIWSDGFLRITLNLLDAIGSGVAVEAANFVGQFPLQLTRASLSFSTSINRVSGSEGLTLGAACELANLSLISFVLERFRLAGASSAVDSTQILPLDGFDEHKAGIANDLKDVLDQEVQFRLKREVPTNEVEMAWSRAKVAKGEMQTLLDKKITKEVEDARKCLLPDGED